MRAITNMNNEKLKDNLIHYKANYWIATLLCGVILSLLINNIISGSYSISTIFYFILLILLGKVSNHLTKLIKNINMELESDDSL